MAAAVLMVGLIALTQAGGGGEAKVIPSALGDITTKEAVIQALDSTGYEFRYRQVPRLEGYEVISGEAINGSDGIQFVVDIRLAGPYEDISKRSEENPQPGILRFGEGEEGEVVGNIIYHTEYNSPDYPGRGYELESDKAQTAMSINVGVALRELFAPRFRPIG